MTPRIDLLIGDVGETEDPPIICHKIEETVGLLCISRADNIPPSHQMLCEESQIIPDIPVALIRISRIPNNRAAPLYIDNAVSDTQRRDITASVILLIPRRDVRRLYRLTARNRPRVSVRKDDKVIADVHVTNAI